MNHTTDIRDVGVLAGHEEPDFSVESPDIDVLLTPRQGCFHTIRHMAQTPRRTAMTNRPRYRDRPRERRIHAVTAFAHNPVNSHTHVQQVAAGQLVNRLR